MNSAGNTAGQYAQDAKNQASHQSNQAGKYAQVLSCLVVDAQVLSCLVVDAQDKLRLLFCIKLDCIPLTTKL